MVLQLLAKLKNYKENDTETARSETARPETARSERRSNLLLFNVLQSQAKLRIIRKWKTRI